MDFGAADFKTKPAVGNLVVLELSTRPMIASFDTVSNGALCAAIVEKLERGEPAKGAGCRVLLWFARQGGITWHFLGSRRKQSEFP
jgi:hypothetical protein